MAALERLFEQDSHLLSIEERTQVVLNTYGLYIQLANAGIDVTIGEYSVPFKTKVINVASDLMDGWSDRQITIYDVCEIKTINTNNVIDIGKAYKIRFKEEARKNIVDVS